ncbi:hypothetical protein HAX54_016113 [Datura stramonium]|uniref:Pentatricopeptide repeat-containing protein n=1 Tax=Datura stramonium TaxID=4076 RepID=A0ABS8RZM1_DATST|nr:hypothetical protein [Datura stramonium]
MNDPKHEIYSNSTKLNLVSSPIPKMRATVHRPIISSLFSSLSLRSISSSSAVDHHPKTLTSPPPFSDELPDPNPRSRTRTPLEKQFESWINNLRPGFTPADVNEALRAQTDPDLALDIFRWTGQQRGYKHNHVTYLNMINIAVSKVNHAHYLVEGSCNMSSLFRGIRVNFLCETRHASLVREV